MLQHQHFMLLIKTILLIDDYLIKYKNYKRL